MTAVILFLLAMVYKPVTTIAYYVQIRTHKKRRLSAFLLSKLRLIQLNHTVHVTL